LPGEEGDYRERRVYKLDILERSIEESTHRFERYLKYDAVCSREALASARADYKEIARARQIGETLPDAWKKLVEDEDEDEDEDELLLELVADCVEELCGFKPDPNAVARFLKDNALQRPFARVSASPATPQLSVPGNVRASWSSPLQSSSVGFTFTLLGQSQECRNALDVLVSAIEALATRDPEFLGRFISLPKHGRKRRYVAGQRGELYPTNPELAEKHSRQLRSGYWLGTNVSHQQIESILKTACEVAGLRYGSDLAITLGA